VNNRWRPYISAVEDTWAECFDLASDCVAAIEDSTAENEILCAAASEEDDVDRAARQALAARQEVADLRRQLVEVEEMVQVSEAAVRMMMASGARSEVSIGNATNTFTIDPR
jgi:hypothetical protein